MNTQSASTSRQDASQFFGLPQTEILFSSGQFERELINIAQTEMKNNGFELDNVPTDAAQQDDAGLEGAMDDDQQASNDDLAEASGSPSTLNELLLQEGQMVMQINRVEVPEVKPEQSLSHNIEPLFKPKM